MYWTEAALERLQQIPFFVRAQVRSRIEQWAQARDHEEVTVELVEAARKEFGQ